MLTYWNVEKSNMYHSKFHIATNYYPPYVLENQHYKQQEAEALALVVKADT